MFKFSVLVLLTIQLAVAIVVKKNQFSNDEQTTFPTNPYNPIQPVTEQSASITVLTEPQGNYHHANNYPSFDLGDMTNFKKYTVVSTYSSDDGITNSERIQQLKPFSVTRFESLNKPYPLITHSSSSNPVGSSWSNTPNGWSNMPNGWSNMPNGWTYNPSGDFETNSRPGFIKVSSSNTYFDSDTMDKPVTRHFKIDVRNGNIISNN